MKVFLIISDESISEIVNVLQNECNCDELNENFSKQLQGIFIQDNEMKDSFKNYPELIFADSTYKLLDLELPIFILMVENSNGESEIVAMGILVNEELETLEWFFEVFVRKNPSSNKTAVAITDKDLSERAVLKKVLPNCRLRLCRLHFERKLRATNLEFFLQRLITRSHYLKPCAVAKPKRGTKNFTNPSYKLRHLKLSLYDNPHNIFEQWTAIAKHCVGCFGNKTNNRLESFN